MSKSTYEKKKDKKPGLYTQWFLQLNTDGSKLPSQMKQLRQLCLEECSSRASHTWPVPLSSPSHLSVPTVAAKYPDKILVIIVTIVNRIVNTCWGSADLWVRNTVLLLASWHSGIRLVVSICFLLSSYIAPSVALSSTRTRASLLFYRSWASWWSQMCPSPCCWGPCYPAPQ